MNDAQPSAELRDFPLVPERPSLFGPLLLGLVTGLLVVNLLGGSGATGLVVPLGGLAAALLTSTLVSALGQRQSPDRLRITADRVSLLRAERVLRSVKLALLTEVQEVETADGGRILLIGDDRRIIGLGSFQLEREREYPKITEQIVEAMQRLDPSGERARAAVTAGRLRARLAQQPVRGTIYLGVGLFLLSLLAMRAADSALAGRPFALEALAGIAPELVRQGETWRLFSHAFVPADLMQALLATISIFWLGTWLERLLGWERVLLGFLAGVVAAGASLVLADWPVPFLGADGGVFGLLGMVLAVRFVSGSRLPRWFRPGLMFWIISVFVALQLPIFQRSLSVPNGGNPVPLTPELTEAGQLAPDLMLLPWLPHFAALLAGLVVGALLVAGSELPASDGERRRWWPFAWVACLALAIGLAGAVSHPFRGHAEDAALIADGLASLPPNAYAAEIQNGYAYDLLVPGQLAPTAEAVVVGAYLAEAAAASSERRSWHVLDTLAVARYRQKRPDDARDVLLEARRAAETDDLDEANRRAVLDRIDRRLKEFEAGGPLSRE